MLVHVPGNTPAFFFQVALTICLYPFLVIIKLTIGLGIAAREEAHNKNTLARDPFSEIQGQLIGREEVTDRAKSARRKFYKNGEIALHQLLGTFDFCQIINFVSPDQPFLGLRGRSNPFSRRIPTH